MASRKKAAEETSAVNMFGPLSEITCQPLTELPYGMYSARSVVIEDVVYVGGGYTAEKDGVNNLIFKFIAKDNAWVILPPCTVTQFGLAAINGKPVTIGGRDILSRGKTTAVCFEFDSETDSWQRSTSISDMPTARYGLDCVSNSEIIIAVGGTMEDGTSCNCVEVFSTDSKRWYAECPLPESQSLLTLRKFHVPEPVSHGFVQPVSHGFVRPVSHGFGLPVGHGFGARLSQPLTSPVQQPQHKTSSSTAVINNHLFVKHSSSAVSCAPVSLISGVQERELDCPLPKAMQPEPAYYQSVHAQPSLESAKTRAPTGHAILASPTPTLPSAVLQTSPVACTAAPIQVKSQQKKATPQKETPQQWETLTTSPTDHSPLMNLRGCLACLGEESSDPGKLFVFLSSPKAWVPLFELPKGSYDYSCAAVLSNGDLVIIGGRDANGVSDKVVRISVA